MIHPSVAAVFVACCILGVAGCRESGDAAPEAGRDSEAAAKAGEAGAAKVDEPVTIADVKLFPLRVDVAAEGTTRSLWGYMDGAGKMVIEPQFAEAHPFHEGRALIKDEDGKYGVIDELGQIILKPTYAYARDYAEGLAAVVVSGTLLGEDMRWGYVNTSGQLAIPGPFLGADSFSEGLGCVRVASGPKDAEGKWGFIDKTGKTVIAPQYAYAKPFSEDLAAAAMDEDAWGFIDHAGTFVIASGFRYAESFSEGLALASEKGRPKDGWPMYGYIDRQGKFAIEPRLPFAGQFRGGLVLAKRTRLDVLKPDCGYLDRTGRWAIPAQYASVSSYSEGRAAVQVAGRFASPEGRHSYIDRSGKRITADEFAAAESFYGGLAQVEITVEGRHYMGYIDRQGQYVDDPWKAAGVPEGDPRRKPSPPAAETIADSTGGNAADESFAKAKTGLCVNNLRQLGQAIRTEEMNNPKADEAVTLDRLLEKKVITEVGLLCPHAGREGGRGYFYRPPDVRDDAERLVACDLRPHSSDDNSRGVLYANGLAKAVTPEEFEKELAKPLNKAFAEAFRKAGGK